MIAQPHQCNVCDFGDKRAMFCPHGLDTNSQQLKSMKHGKTIKISGFKLILKKDLQERQIQNTKI